jgi:hypothetical protein
VGSVRIDQEGWQRIFTPARVAAVVVALLVVVAGTLFFVHTHSQLRDTRGRLSLSQDRLARLDVVEQDAVVERAKAFAALQRARDALAADTAARDQLRAADRAELARLSAALKSLSQHQAGLAAGTARAKLLDDCLVGASQVLNEAAVSDVVHLRTTLPPVQLLCSQAAA